MPVVVVALMWRMHNPVFGAVAAAILLMSLILHEIAHLFFARQFHCLPGSVVIWPLGGMIFSHQKTSFRQSLAVHFSGACVSLVIASLCAWELHQLDLLKGLLNPFGMLDLSVTDNFAHNCLRVAFVVNYCLGLFNLIPVRPLDAGQAFAAFLNLRFVELETRDLMLRIGLVVSLFGILAGFVFDISSLVALSAFLLVMHIHEVSQWNPPQDVDDSFLGYDFSEGYTSLDRADGSSRQDDSSRPDDEADAGFGILDRWKARREEEHAARECEERAQEEHQLDRILEKLHLEGRESLTAKEVGILNRVSARLRQRNVQD